LKAKKNKHRTAQAQTLSKNLSDNGQTNAEGYEVAMSEQTRISTSSAPSEFFSEPNLALQDLLSKLMKRLDLLELRFNHFETKAESEPRRLAIEEIEERFDTLEKRLDQLEEDVNLGNDTTQAHCFLSLDESGGIEGEDAGDDAWKDWDVELARPDSLEARIEALEEKLNSFDSAVDRDLLDELGDRLFYMTKKINRLMFLEGIPERLRLLELRLERVELDISSVDETSQAHSIVEFEDGLDMVEIEPPEDPWRDWDVELVRPDSLESRIESLEDKLSSFDAAVDKDLLEEVGDRVYNLLRESRKLRHIKEIQHELERLKDELESRSSIPLAFQEIRLRVENAIQVGAGLQSKKLLPKCDAKALVRKLAQQNFFLNLRTATQILTKVSTHRIVILEGAPGTGKTTLARLLPQCILEEGTTAHHVFASVTPEWTEYQTIGGPRKIGDHFGPYLGCLTEAVLKANENRGNCWLILDEINRGDVSAFLSPLLAGTDLARGFMIHEHCFTEQCDTKAEIPIPGSFRIIGTMNTFDKDTLFDFSEALKRRCELVLIEPPSREEEILLLKELCIKTFFDNYDGPKLSINKFMEKYRLLEAIDILMSTAYKVRELQKNEPQWMYRNITIGTAVLIDIMNKILLTVITYGLPSNDKGNCSVQNIIDNVLADALVERLPIKYTEVLQSLLDTVFTLEQFPESRNRMISNMKKRRIF